MKIKRKLSLSLPEGFSDDDDITSEGSKNEIDLEKYAEEFVSGAESKRKKYTKNMKPWHNIEKNKTTNFRLRADSILMSKITYFSEKYDISKHKLVLRMLNRELKRLEGEDDKSRYYGRKEKDI